MTVEWIATPVIDTDEKRSRPTCCMGNPKCVEGDGVDIEFEG